jgi:hypothetical protein
MWSFIVCLRTEKKMNRQGAEERQTTQTDLASGLAFFGALAVRAAQC